MDYAIGEFLYMLPSDMNLQIGKVKNYNNKIMVSKPGFSLGTNLKVNLDDDDTKVSKPDKPVIKPNKEHKQDVKPNIKFEQDTITYEEEKVALVLGSTAIFTVWWMFK